MRCNNPTMETRRGPTSPPNEQEEFGRTFYALNLLSDGAR